MTDAAAAVLRLRSESGRLIGRNLPALLRRLKAAVESVVSEADEVARFRPPRTSLPDWSSVRALADAALCAGELIFACVAQGWAESPWSAASEHLMAGRSAALELEAVVATVHPSQPHEDPYLRALGFSENQLQRGAGVSWRARLLAAWMSDAVSLDRRMRRMMRHLLDDSLPLTIKLRLHLATLAMSDRPLLAHRATIEARELVTSLLMTDREQTCSVIAKGADREPEMLFLHRSHVEYVAAYSRASHPDGRARAAMDLYRSVLEGDLKRTSVTVLELLGRRVPDSPSLSAIRGLLESEEQPICALLASTIRPGWRNANAHEEFRWDPIGNTMLLRGQAADVDEVILEALRAREICRAFEHGVAVAYAHNLSLVSWSAAKPSYVSRDQSVLDTAGSLGVPVVDISREGTTVRLDVPDLTILVLRDVCRVILYGAAADPQVERWEVWQTSSDLPPLIVDCAGTAAGSALAERAGADTDPMPFAALAMLANAMSCGGERSEAASALVLTLAAAHVLDERDRLAANLARGEESAEAELLNIVGLVSQGLRAAAQLLEDPGRSELLSFARALAEECDRSANVSSADLVHAFAPASQMLRSTRRLVCRGLGRQRISTGAIPRSSGRRTSAALCWPSDCDSGRMQRAFRLFLAVEADRGRTKQDAWPPDGR
ncbi:hypothetical protein EV651_107177 [Kribbella sp. VKM Ac-2571]|nr:hypothetical protein EV651_107177 [Kribbella sp. VKM Ac-2571]